jgi:hypothetical protein
MRERERGVLSGGLVVPAHARVASDSVFLTLSGGWFRCNTTATLGPAQRWPFRCGGACPSATLSVVRLSPMVRYSLEGGLWVELSFVFVSFVVGCM